MNASLRLFWLFAVLVTVAFSSVAVTHDVAYQSPLLTAFVTDSAPWKDIIANSDQVQPVYLGLTPRELSLGIGNASANAYTPIPSYMKALGILQLRTIVDELELGTQMTLFEGWPAYDQLSGKFTWSWARWKKPSDVEWTFIWSFLDDQGNVTTGFLPQIYKPWVDQDFYDIFTPFWRIPDLYAKPVFGDCIWASEDNSNIYGAWFNPKQMELIQSRIMKINAKAPVGKRVVCLTLPQPCRNNGKPTSFVAQIQNGLVTFPSGINWTTPVATLPPITMNLTPLVNFPEDFADLLAQDIKTFDGELVAKFPISGRNLTFTMKNSAQVNNQIPDLVAYLEERYQMLGIKTIRYPFTWINITQYNLVAVIPGSDPSLKPVLLADHIDTAFAEDTFDKTGQRVSNPGADDNSAAIATLLNGAAVLSSLNLTSEVWLVHLTGEEFPADDLGVRNLLSHLLKSKLDFRAMVLLDMMSYRQSNDKVVQVNAGSTPSSLFAAKMAMATSQILNLSLLEPVYRSRFDDRSYLYNTDGVIVDAIGYPVILINEHINAIENLDRPYYHQSTDLFKTLDIAYGSQVAKLAIESAAQLSNWKYIRN